MSSYSDVSTILISQLSSNFMDLPENVRRNIYAKTIKNMTEKMAEETVSRYNLTAPVFFGTLPERVRYMTADEEYTTYRYFFNQSVCLGGLNIYDDLRKYHSNVIGELKCSINNRSIAYLKTYYNIKYSKISLKVPTTVTAEDVLEVLNTKTISSVNFNNKDFTDIVTKMNLLRYIINSNLPSIRLGLSTEILLMAMYSLVLQVIDASIPRSRYDIGENEIHFLKIFNVLDKYIHEMITVTASPIEEYVYTTSPELSILKFREAEDLVRLSSSEKYQQLHTITPDCKTLEKLQQKIELIQESPDTSAWYIEDPVTFLCNTMYKNWFC